MECQTATRHSSMERVRDRMFGTGNVHCCMYMYYTLLLIDIHVCILKIM